MKFSIITVSYNARHTIRSTIESVLSQQINEVEYIIIDGQSNDGTVEIISQFDNKIAQWISEPDNGIYDAMNKGLGLATGDVIGILNADDFYCRPDVLERIQKCFTEYPEVDGVYSDLVYVDKQDTNKIIRTWIAGPFNRWNFFMGWMPPHPTLFFRKSVYEEIGCFNVNFKSAADYELLLRACLKYRKILHYIPGVVVNMRTGGRSNSTLKNRIKANSEDRLAWKVNGLKGGYIASILKPFRKITQFFIK